MKEVQACNRDGCEFNHRGVCTVLKGEPMIEGYPQNCSFFKEKDDCNIDDNGWPNKDIRGLLKAYGIKLKTAAGRLGPEYKKLVYKFSRLEFSPEEREKVFECIESIVEEENVSSNEREDIQAD